MLRRFALVALAGLLLAVPSSAWAVDRFDVLSVSTLGHLQPVRGSDGRQHLVYELQLRNVSAELGVVVEQIRVRAGADGRTVATLAGDALAPNMNLGDPFAPTPTTTIGPGQSGVVWMDLDFPSRAAVPSSLRHVISLSVAPGGDPAVFASRYDTTVVSEPRRVDRRPPPVLASPLRGRRFVAFNGCCASPGHVRTALAVDGRQRVAERFAIDWMQADRRGRLWKGEGTRNDEFFVYGRPIRSVARGRVVAAVDRYPDTPPGQRTTDTVSPTAAAGNHVIVDIGHGRYALYAHIKPGTVRVKAGQRVRAGQVLGLVGSSGNSDAPHLHFHLTDRPSPLAADGLPYVHRRFALEGRVVGEELRWRERPRPRARELPLDFTIVRFP